MPEDKLLPCMPPNLIDEEVEEDTERCADIANMKNLTGFNFGFEDAEREATFRMDEVIAADCDLFELQMKNGETKMFRFL